MLAHKNILSGLGRAVYGGKPHDVPKALQSVNMKNTSEETKQGGAGGLWGCACIEMQTCGWYVPLCNQCAWYDCWYKRCGSVLLLRCAFLKKTVQRVGYTPCYEHNWLKTYIFLFLLCAVQLLISTCCGGGRMIVEAFYKKCSFV